MEISGHFYQINNLDSFTVSLILNQNIPNPNTYSPTSDVRVFSAFVGVFTNKLLSELLVKTPTKAEKVARICYPN